MPRPRRKKRRAPAAGPRDLVWEKTTDGRWTQVPRCESARYKDDALRAVEAAGVVLPLLDVADEACRRAGQGDDAMLLALIEKLSKATSAA
jgi:hypothetical protein